MDGNPDRALVFVSLVSLHVQTFKVMLTRRSRWQRCSMLRRLCRSKLLVQLFQTALKVYNLSSPTVWHNPKQSSQDMEEKRAMCLQEFCVMLFFIQQQLFDFSVTAAAVQTICRGCCHENCCGSPRSMPLLILNTNFCKLAAGF